MNNLEDKTNWRCDTCGSVSGGQRLGDHYLYHKTLDDRARELTPWMSQASEFPLRITWTWEGEQDGF